MKRSNKSVSQSEEKKVQKELAFYKTLLDDVGEMNGPRKLIFRQELQHLVYRHAYPALASDVNAEMGSSKVFEVADNIFKNKMSNESEQSLQLLNANASTSSDIMNKNEETQHKSVHSKCVKSKKESEQSLDTIDLIDLRQSPPPESKHKLAIKMQSPVTTKKKQLTVKKLTDLQGLKQAQQQQEIESQSQLQELERVQQRRVEIERQLLMQQLATQQQQQQRLFQQLQHQHQGQLQTQQTFLSQEAHALQAQFFVPPSQISVLMDVSNATSVTSIPMQFDNQACPVSTIQTVFNVPMTSFAVQTNHEQLKLATNDNIPALPNEGQNRPPRGT